MPPPSNHLHLLLVGKLSTTDGHLANFKVWTGKVGNWSQLEIFSLSHNRTLVNQVCNSHGQLVETLLDGPCDIHPIAVGWVYLGSKAEASFKLKRTGLIDGYLLEVYTPDGRKQRFKGLKQRPADVFRTLMVESIATATAPLSSASEEGK